MAAVTVGVAGKGGAGKTTVAAVLARALARRGLDVVVIDADSDPHLAMGLGMPLDAAARIRPLLNQSGPRRLPEGLAPKQVLAEYALPAPDGVMLLLAAQVERAGSG
ncbi:MAG: AAA family ATPase [Actinobacteria bacterium]|nr:AAA family ATPase [Actinomycetota bacterium]